MIIDKISVSGLPFLVLLSLVVGFTQLGFIVLQVIMSVSLVAHTQRTPGFLYQLNAFSHGKSEGLAKLFFIKL